MRMAITAFFLVFLVAGCASQGTQVAGVEERDLFGESEERQRELERAEAEKQAQIQREQEELNRQLEEQRRQQQELDEARAMNDQPDIRPLSDIGLDASQTQGDPWAKLGEPGSLLAKRSIYYEFDRYDIQDEYVPLIEAHANFLLQHPELKIIVQGNCDDRGSREYNLALGQRRAESVKRAMSLLGVRDDQIESVSFGAEKPVAFGQDEESWAQNRRSDITYVGEPK